MCKIAFCLHHVLFLYSFFSRVDSLRVFVPEHPSPLFRRYEAGELTGEEETGMMTAHKYGALAPPLKSPFFKKNNFQVAAIHF